MSDRRLSGRNIISDSKGIGLSGSLQNLRDRDLLESLPVVEWSEAEIERYFTELIALYECEEMVWH